MISGDVVERVLAAIKSPQEFGYFFGKLKTPDWIEPLRKAGLFKPDPPLTRDNQTYSVRWAPSAYLARMASAVPELVTETFERMEPSDNPWIHWDIADAAGKMPAEYAARLAIIETKWIATQTFISGLLAREYAELVRKLAQGRREDLAVALFRVMFGPLPEPKVSSIGLRDAQTRVERAWYDDTLKKLLPDLISATPDRVLQVVCDLLAEVMSIEYGGDNAASSVDFSEIWRPGIEDENDRHGMAEALVSAVRDTAVRLSLQSLDNRSRVVGALESRRWHVFRRIAMHVICEGGEAARALAEERILVRENFNNTAFRHEYARLLRVFFGQLSVVKQNIVLGWIEEGYPHLAKWAEHWKAETGSEPSEPERRDVSDHWKFERIHPFHDSLPSEWKARYSKWRERFGPPKLEEYRTQTRWGGVSPKTRDELARMNAADLASYLLGFEPSGRWDEPDIYGLAQELRAAIVIGAVRFSAEAAAFKIEAPEYVDCVLEGFGEAARAGTALDWQPILDLCEWIVRQPREIAGREGKKYDLQDRPPGWKWVRSSVASLIEHALGGDSGVIPFALREPVWSVLAPIPDDPDPAFDGSDEGELEGDPFTRSLNRTRGKAIHAVVRYVVWVARHLPRPDEKELRLARGLDEIPEARAVLERHLDPGVDRSPAIRSIYGCYFPLLAAIDPAWGSAARNRVFPIGEHDDPLWEAAWEGYVVNNPVYGFATELLTEYRRAVERSHELKDDKHLSGDPSKRLAEHIMIFFGRGTVTLGDDSLVERFFGRAPPELQRRAIQFVGESVSGEHPPPIEVVERFKALWAWLVARAERSPSGSVERVALAAFGAWFTAGRFGRAWSMIALQRALNLAQGVDDSFHVIRSLVDYVGELPAPTLQCLRRIIETDLEGWTVSASTGEVGAILSKAMAASDKGIVRDAVEIVHLLGSRGLHSFRGLLAT